MALHVRSLGRDFLCTFFLACIVSGIFIDAEGDSLGTAMPESSKLRGARQDSASVNRSTHIPNPPQASDTTGIVSLDRMVVTASRRQRLLETTQSLSIIRPDEWVGTSKSIADVVAEQTGVQTCRYGGVGSFQTVTVRGVQGSEVIVLLDGIPLNSAMGGAVDLGAINPERIGEIEVYKGIVPAEFGGNGIGGVINLKSKTSTTQTAGVQAAIGAYGLQQYVFETNKAYADRYRIFSSLNYKQSDNDWPYLDRNNTPYNPADDVIRTVENHHHHSFVARLHPSIDLPGERTVVSGISYSSAETGVAAPEGSINRTARYRKNMFGATVRLFKEESSGNSVLVLTPAVGYERTGDKLSFTSLDQSMGTSHGGIGSTPDSYGEMRSDEDIFHAACIADIFLTENIGGQAIIQGKHSQIVTITHVTGFHHGDWPGNSQEASLAADINGTLPMASSLSLGMIMGGSIKAVRSATYGGRNEALEMTVLPSDTIEYPWALRGALQCRWKDQLSVFVNAGRYSSIPALREKFGSNGPVIPNPDLTEETSITVDCGFRFLHDRFFAEAVFFRTETQNGIVMLSDGSMTKPVNLAAAVTTGIETSLWWQPLDFIKTELRVTSQNAENRSRLHNNYGKKLPNEPDLSIFDKVTLGPFRGVEISYWCDFQSFIYRDFGNTPRWRFPEDTDDPGLFLHNAQITWKLLKVMTLNCSIENIMGNLGRDKSVGPGYYWVLTPPNKWQATVQYTF